MYYGRSRSPAPYSSGLSYNSYSSDLTTRSFTPRNRSIQRVLDTDFVRPERSRSPIRDYSTRSSSMRTLPSVLSSDTSPVLRRRELDLTSQITSDSRGSPVNWLRSDDYSLGPKPKSYYDFTSTPTRLSSYTSPVIKMPRRIDYSDYLRPSFQSRPTLKADYTPRPRSERDASAMPIVRERKLIKFREITNEILNKVKRKVSWDLPEEIQSPLINEMRNRESPLNEKADTIRSRDSSLTRHESKEILPRESSLTRYSPREPRSRECSLTRYSSQRRDSYPDPGSPLTSRGSSDHYEDRMSPRNLMRLNTDYDATTKVNPPPRKKSVGSVPRIKKHRRSSIENTTAEERSLNYSIIADKIRRCRESSDTSQLPDNSSNSNFQDTPTDALHVDEKSDKILPDINNAEIAPDHLPRRRRRISQDRDDSKTRRQRSRSELDDTCVSRETSSSPSLSEVPRPINRMHRKSVKYKVDKSLHRNLSKELDDMNQLSTLPPAARRKHSLKNENVDSVDNSPQNYGLSEMKLEDAGKEENTLSDVKNIRYSRTLSREKLSQSKDIEKESKAISALQKETNIDSKSSSCQTVSKTPESLVNKTGKPSKKNDSAFKPQIEHSLVTNLTEESNSKLNSKHLSNSSLETTKLNKLNINSLGIKSVNKIPSSPEIEKSKFIKVNEKAENSRSLPSNKANKECSTSVVNEQINSSGPAIPTTSKESNESSTNNKLSNKINLNDARMLKISNITSKDENILLDASTLSPSSKLLVKESTLDKRQIKSNYIAETSNKSSNIDILGDKKNVSKEVENNCAKVSSSSANTSIDKSSNRTVFTSNVEKQNTMKDQKLVDHQCEDSAIKILPVKETVKDDEIVVVCKLPQPKKSSPVIKPSFSTDTSKIIPVDQAVVVSIVNSKTVLVSEKEPDRKNATGPYVQLRIPNKKTLPTSKKDVPASEIDLSNKTRRNASHSSYKEGPEVSVVHTVVLKPKSQNVDSSSEQSKDNSKTAASAVRLKSIPDVIQSAVNKPAPQAKESSTNNVIVEKAPLLPSIKKEMGIAANSEHVSSPKIQLPVKEVPDLMKISEKTRECNQISTKLGRKDVLVVEESLPEKRTISSVSKGKSFEASSTKPDLINVKIIPENKVKIENGDSSNDLAKNEISKTKTSNSESVMHLNGTKLHQNENISSTNDVKQTTNTAVTKSLISGAKKFYKKSVTVPDVNAILLENSSSLSKHNDSSISGTSSKEKNAAYLSSSSVPATFLETEKAKIDSLVSDNRGQKTKIAFKDEKDFKKTTDLNSKALNKNYLLGKTEQNEEKEHHHHEKDAVKLSKNNNIYADLPNHSTVPDILDVKKSIDGEPVLKLAVKKSSNGDVVSKPDVKKSSSGDAISKPDVKKNSSKDAVSKPDVKKSSSGDAVSKPDVKKSCSGDAVSKPDVKKSTSGDAVSKPDVKKSTSGDAVSKPDVKKSSSGDAVSKPEVKKSSSGDAVSKPEVKKSSSKDAVSKPDVKKSSNGDAVSNPDVKKSTSGDAVTKPDVEKSSSGDAVSKSEVKKSSRKDAISKPDVKKSSSGDAVSKPDVKKSTSGDAVSKPDVKKSSSGDSVSKPDVKESDSRKTISELSSSPDIIKHTNINLNENEKSLRDFEIEAYKQNDKDCSKKTCLSNKSTPLQAPDICKTTESGRITKNEKVADSNANANEIILNHLPESGAVKPTEVQTGKICVAVENISSAVSNKLETDVNGNSIDTSLLSKQNQALTNKSDTKTISDNESPKINKSSNKASDNSASVPKVAIKTDPPKPPPVRYGLRFSSLYKTILESSSSSESDSSDSECSSRSSLSSETETPRKPIKTAHPKSGK
ncbi:uncharacterized protein TNCT_1841 [Trichonephila clavata]|uniref:Uncharacterized protein n=1 Tax=Trichonephila clavata TaxID=2740835 RepID=A0A8X6L6W3_TRICU|nr:uncharacterized protein TNCT_1841 [Trichonephila clavata]